MFFDIDVLVVFCERLGRYARWGGPGTKKQGATDVR